MEFHQLLYKNTLHFHFHRFIFRAIDCFFYLHKNCLGSHVCLTTTFTYVVVTGRFFLLSQFCLQNNALNSNDIIIDLNDDCPHYASSIFDWPLMKFCGCITFTMVFFTSSLLLNLKWYKDQNKRIALAQYERDQIIMFKYWLMRFPAFDLVWYYTDPITFNKRKLQNSGWTYLLLIVTFILLYSEFV